MVKEYTKKENIYLCACSGGPDSMALLNMLYKEDVNIVVCHVNYSTREQSDEETKMVASFCKERNIKFEYIKVHYEKENGNFEAWARKIRYSFFKEKYDYYDAKGVFVAHHKDDFLETYIMQKRRGGIYSYYGISERSQVENMDIIRPLLKFRKTELENYCKKENIPYSIDSTNLENVHTRNIIRHNIVEKLNCLECDKIFYEAQTKNMEQKKMLDKVKKLFYKNSLEIKSTISLSSKEKMILIYEFVKSNIPSFNGNLSYLRIQELIKIMESDKPNSSAYLSNELYFVKEYDHVFIKKSEEETTFRYEILAPSVVDEKEFFIDLRGDTSFLKITSSSYPLVARNASKDDFVYFGNVKKKVNRILIDAKIPFNKRKNYPLFEDCNGKIVYIPLFTTEEQKNIAKKLKFVLK